jgi:hypothetical protein
MESRLLVIMVGMKTRNALLVIIVLSLSSVFIAGCGSDAEQTANGPATSDSIVANKGPVAVNVDPKEVNDPTVAVLTDANSNSVSNSNSGIAAISNVADMKQAKLDKLRSGNGGGPAPAGAQPLRREAPDNSLYWSTLTDVALETRQFRDNAQIGKVEKVNDGRKSTIKIYLRNGKLVEVPGEKVADISRESVTTFINLAGLKPPAPPQPPPASAPNPEKQRSVTILPKVQ